MRRGLMAWDAKEIPIGVLRERIERLQGAMAAAGQDALILYTNFVRSGAVSYLTAFSPYWADGVLLVPKQGEPIFATTLSKRVGSWIQSVKPIGDLVNSPKPVTVIGERLASGGSLRRVGILEIDAFPSGLYDELSAALPGVEIVDGTETFAAARRVLDDVERRLLERADQIAEQALDSLQPKTGANVGAAVGAVEHYARATGAEEVYVATARDLDLDRSFLRLSGSRPLGARFAIRVTVAYKGAWVRRIKTYAHDSKDVLAINRADAWFKSLLTAINSRHPLNEQLAATIATLSEARLTGWLAEAPAGTRPLAAVASAEEAENTLAHVPALILTLSLNVGGVPWCGAGLAFPR